MLIMVITTMLLQLAQKATNQAELLTQSCLRETENKEKTAEFQLQL